MEPDSHSSSEFAYPTETGLAPDSKGRKKKQTNTKEKLIHRAFVFE